MSLTEDWLDQEISEKRTAFSKQADGVGSKLALTTLNEIADLLITQKQLKLFAAEPAQHSRGVIEGIKALKGEIEAALKAAR